MAPKAQQQAPVASIMLSEAAVKGGCAVTLAFLALYTVFFMAQLLVKIILVKSAQRRHDDKVSKMPTPPHFCNDTHSGINNSYDLVIVWCGFDAATAIVVSAVVLAQSKIGSTLQPHHTFFITVL